MIETMRAVATQMNMHTIFTHGAVCGLERITGNVACADRVSAFADRWPGNQAAGYQVERS